MCKYGEHHVAAASYLSDAKKRNKHLKKLKSVSRAYRKGEVRRLKALAHEAELKAGLERQANEERWMQARKLQEATSFGQSDMGAYGYRGNTSWWPK